MKENNQKKILHELEKELIKRLESTAKPIGSGFLTGELFINNNHVAATIQQVFSEYEDKLKFMNSSIEDTNWFQCKSELIVYAMENNIDLCIDSDPIGFEILIDKYIEMKECYKGYSKEEILKDAIDEWEMEQESDLI